MTEENAGLGGKVSLVTGGGRGIGRALAVAFAQAGADVCVAARSASEVQAVADEIRAAGGRAVDSVCDVRDYKQAERTVRQCRDELGALDILVNNAGGHAERRALIETDPAVWEQVIAVNLVGSYNMARAALPGMVAAGGGKIINVGSGMGHSAQVHNTAYNSAKAGLWMMTRCLAMEVWEHGIEVNELIPGPVYTQLTADRFDPTNQTPPPIAASERVKQPEDCVALAMFLAAHPPGGPTGQSFSLARRPL